MDKEREEEIENLRKEAGGYALRNRTQRLIMKEIIWYHDLIFMKHQPRFFNDWFRLKHYLFKKYNIPYNNSFSNNDK